MNDDIENVLYADFQGLGRLSTASANFDPGGVMNEVEEDDAGSAGFSTKKVGAKFDAEILKTAALTIKQIRDFRGTITITTASGTTWVMLNARCVSETPLSSGRVKAEFASINAAQEVGA